MKTRDAYYDNAKFLLIFFVVFGHFLQSYIHEEKWIYTVYTTIYTFHMPAFILISGFFAKGFHKKGYITKIAKKLIIPYLLFQGIYSMYYFFIYKQNSIEIDPLDPQWSLWFLISLFFWNTMLFMFTKWKPIIALTISVALGLLIGYFDVFNNVLSLSRTFVFFPFFLLGYYFKKEHFEKIRDLKFKYISLISLISIIIAIYILPDFNYKWLFGSKPYDQLIDGYLYGGIIRLCVYALTLLATLSFLAIVPRQKYFFTKWGTSSIYVYLLHGFFVKYFRSSEYVGVLPDSQQIFALIILSLLLIAFLSSEMIRNIAQPFIELKLSLFKKYRMDLSQYHR